MSNLLKRSMARPVALALAGAVFIAADEPKKSAKGGSTATRTAASPHNEFKRLDRNHDGALERTRALPLQAG